MTKLHKKSLSKLSEKVLTSPIIQERVWVNNYYRSVPTTNLKLYTANLLATCLSFLIYAAFEGVVLLALAVTRWGINLPTGDPMTVLVEMGIFLIVLGIFIWAFISLVHLLSVTIMAFLPETRIRLVQWIIYLVVIIVASFIFDQVQRLFLLPFGGYDSNTLTGSSSVLVGIGIFIVTILLISAVNVYLLEKWVETK
ncbi:ABC transporter permease [Lacticaseibacillus paracasei]|uniref:ABC transporter permease n=1 Tax=Lacticaseibacillus paracasei TaxID=1597 RepID=UPI00288B9FBC|nr:ABC transporter permease [Lacticaseibacillus paracasei]